MQLAEVLAEQIDYTRAWTLKLMEDLKGDDWSHQPGPGMGHPLWLCGHLACSQNFLVHVRCLGTGGVVPKEFSDHFAIGGPVKSAKEHAYPSVDAVKAMMADVHSKTMAAIPRMSDALLVEPCMAANGNPHPYYKDKKGALAHCNRHEGFHAGQIATIRRLLGKSFLR